MKAVALPKPKRPPIDWEAIEREYRAGLLSLYEISATRGISRPAIQKRAKVRGWKRDLAERIRRAVAEKMVAPAAASHDEAATIDDAATNVVGVIRLHQKRAARLSEVVSTLVERLSESELPISILAQSVNNLANANKTLTGIERQAFNLDAAEGDKGAVTVELVRFAALL